MRYLNYNTINTVKLPDGYNIKMLTKNTSQLIDWVTMVKRKVLFESIIRKALLMKYYSIANGRLIVFKRYLFLFFVSYACSYVEQKIR